MRGWVWLGGVLALAAAGCGDTAKSGASAGVSGSGGGAGAASAGGSTTAGQGGSGGSSAAGTSSAGQTSGGATGGAAGSAADNPFPPRFREGACIPSGPELADVPGVISVAGSNTGSIAALLMVGQTLYYNDQDESEVWRRVGPEGEPELVASDVDAWNMFLRGDYLYFVGGNARALSRISLSSLPGSVELIREGIGEDTMGMLATDSDLFFRPYPERGIQVLPLSTLVPGTTATPLSLDAMAQPRHMRLVGDLLYYSDFGRGFFRVPVAGGAEAELFAGVGAPGHFAVGPDELYLVAGESIVKQPFVGGSLASTRIAESAEGDELALPELVGDRIIYRDEAGALAWVKTDGSDCRVIAHVPFFSNLEERDWVMDDQYIYVIERERQLWAIPYP